MMMMTQMMKSCLSWKVLRLSGVQAARRACFLIQLAQPLKVTRFALEARLIILASP